MSDAGWHGMSRPGPIGIRQVQQCMEDFAEVGSKRRW